MNLCQVNAHLFTVIYGRPWRRWFRKTFYLRCWHCDLCIAWPR